MLAGRLARQFANTKNPASDTRRMPTCEDRFGRILGPFPPPASIVNSALAAAERGLCSPLAATVAWAMFTLWRSEWKLDAQTNSVFVLGIILCWTGPLQRLLRLVVHIAPPALRDLAALALGEVTVGAPSSRPLG